MLEAGAWDFRTAIGFAKKPGVAGKQLEAVRTAVEPGRSYRQLSAGSGGGRFKLFVMFCLIIGPLWMWAYHENVPIAVTAWQATSTAYDSVASFSKEAASDASTAISEDINSSPDVQEASRATNPQKYAGGSPLNRGEIEKWVIEFTNEERISAGLQPLRHDVAS